MGIIEKLLTTILKKAEITSKSQLTQNAFHIRLQSDAVIHSNYKAGNFLRIFVGKGRAGNIKDNIRSYSVWQIDQASGCVDIAACTYSNGPGCYWVKNCKIGDSVYYSWHESNLSVDLTASNIVFIGDVSALGHFYELNRGIPNDKQVHSLIYGALESDFFPDIDGSRPFNFLPLTQNPSTEVIRYLDEIKLLPVEKSIALIAGEGRLCADMNNFFRMHYKWKRDQLKIKTFWMPGKKGLE